MFKHCNIELPPHAIYYFSKYTYYLPPSTPFIFYNPHPHLALALALSLSLKGKGMLAKESSQVTALRYSTMLSSSSLALSLSQRSQLSPYSQSLYSTKSQQHRTKCSSKYAKAIVFSMTALF